VHLANPAVGENIAILSQALSLLRQITDQRYAEPASRHLSSCGSHLRHCIDFYASFLRGLDESFVDYSRRERDPEIERSRTRGIERVEAVIRALRSCSSLPAAREMRVISDDACAEGDDPTPARSTLGRELNFLMSHAIHHFALIAVGLRLGGFEPGEGFGVAPSTLRHWRRVS